MKEDTPTLDEVVVVGYGTMKKSDIPGSVASVRLDDLKQGASTSVDQMLLGKSAGMNVVQSSGEPGGGFSVNIRGASSINGEVSPLYVIDGVPIDNSRPVSQGSIVGFSDNRSLRTPMSSITPADIESLEILKDASATAIYGSRGANGVILITTKSGKSEKMKVSYSGSVGIQSPSNKLELLSAADYKNVLNALVDVGGDSEASRVGEIANGGTGTDWQDEVTRKNAITHEHQLPFSGGNSKTYYYFSFNCFKQEGIVKNTSFERIGARLNLKSDINTKLQIGMNVSGTYMKEDYKPGELKYVDQNQDSVIHDADRVVPGNSFPDFQWSLGNTFSYKNFDLYVFFEGGQSVDILNGNLIDSYFPINFRRNKFAEPYWNRYRWTAEHPTAEYPSFADPLKQGRKVVDSRTLSDASYVRLKTIRLSDTFPKLNRLIQSLQVYVTAENLFTLTDYVGLDPAINPNGVLIITDQQRADLCGREGFLLPVPRRQYPFKYHSYNYTKIYHHE